MEKLTFYLKITILQEFIVKMKNYTKTTVNCSKIMHVLVKVYPFKYSNIQLGY